MTRLRTPSQFLSELDDEFSWRLKEIDDVRKSIKQVQATHQRALMRAGLALLYAHWEGFVKNSSELYINYISHLGIPLKNLQFCFAALGIKGHLYTLNASGKSESSISSLKTIIEHFDKTSRIPFREVIDTESNLSSTVFKTIAEWIGIDSEPYVTKNVLIDTKLLERRNKVAHGEQLDIKLADYLALSDEIIDLMRSYKTDLDNAVALKSYLITPAVMPASDMIV